MLGILFESEPIGQHKCFVYITYHIYIKIATRAVFGGLTILPLKWQVCVFWKGSKCFNVLNYPRYIILQISSLH